jgi:hypothetical protein
MSEPLDNPLLQLLDYCRQVKYQIISNLCNNENNLFLIRSMYYTIFQDN